MFDTCRNTLTVIVETLVFFFGQIMQIEEPFGDIDADARSLTRVKDLALFFNNLFNSITSHNIQGVGLALP